MMSDKQKFRAMDWVVGLATTVTLGIVTWLLITTHNHEGRLDVIESSRYSDSDAAHDKAEIVKLIQDEFKAIGHDLGQIKINQAVIQRDVSELKSKP